MKIPLFIFFLIINYCTSQYFGEPKKPITQYPKKVRGGLIQYNNAGNYFKTHAHGHVIKTRKSPNERDYTVFSKPFPRTAEVKVVHQIVPDSPYFPIDDPEPHERRSRVKKVLPEYIKEFQRHKRAADDDDILVKEDAAKSQNTNDVSSPKAAEDASKIDNIAVSKKVNSPTKTKKEQKKLPNTAQKGVKKGNRIRVLKNGTKIMIRSKLQGNRTRTGRLRANKQRKANRLAKNKKQMLARNNLKGKVPPVNSKPIRSKKHTNSSFGNNKRQPTNSKKIKKDNKQQGTNKQKNYNGRKKQDQVEGVLNTASTIETLKNPPASARRLISARDALIEEYPYTVSIQKEGHHWCAGAILNPRLIITTANCLWRSQSISRMRVRVGSRHTDRGGQVARIQEVMKHPGWKLRKDPDNDVALALLDKNIRFSHSLHGVDLPNRVMMPAFDDAWVTSWGSERKDGIYDPHVTQTLQMYHARLLDRNKCNNVTQRFGVTVTENFICLSQVGKRAPCTRDTGAPAVSDGVLWGLASWGIRKLCGTERYPAMFSYLASQSNMDFIANATHLLMADERLYPYLDRYPVKKVTVFKTGPVTLHADLH